ncbi:YaaC family protein [Streptomyces sp. NPDC054829]
MESQTSWSLSIASDLLAQFRLAPTSAPTARHTVPQRRKREHMDGTTAIHLGLRHCRTSLTEKTKLQDSASRRKTFSAALQQFEEQMKAAEVVSPATRPINLYYGLVQAGLAITAAHAEGTWTFDKHGLKIPDMKRGVPDIAVRPEGVGAFQAVSDATGSERTTDAITLGALWNSLPELAEIPLEGTNDILAVELLADSRTSTEATDVWSADHIAESAEFLCATVWVNEEMPSLPNRKAWLQDFITKYPGLEGSEPWGARSRHSERRAPAASPSSSAGRPRKRACRQERSRSSSTSGPLPTASSRTATCGQRSNPARHHRHR